MKKISGFILAMIVALTSVVSTATVMAATEVVPVYLDENPITFASNDAQPQIINNRTYVPIRATCDALGLSIDWNSKTETLTFTREGVVISHTMRSKIVYVNGESTEYDTPSINKNNRTLMPIRMLGESIGADVEWNNTTRSVHITTKKANNDSNNSSDSSDVAIDSVSVSSKKVTDGSSVTVTAIANANTAKVKFTNADSGDTYTEVNEYMSQDDGTRKFEAKIKCSGSEDDVVAINAIPGTATAYTDSIEKIKSVEVTIIADDSSDDSDDSDSSSDETTVKSFESDHFVKLVYTSSIKKNGYVNFTATTDSKVKRVKASSTAADDDVIVKDYDDNDDERVFEGKIKLTDTGSQKVKFDLYTSSGYEDINESFKVTVGSSSSSSSSSNGSGEINDVELVNDTFYISQASPIYVVTTRDIDYIEVLDSDDQTIGKTSFTSSKTNTEKKWDVDVTVRETGRNSYRVVAYVDNEAVDERSVTLNGKKFNRSTPCVLSMEQKDSTIRAGQDCRFTAKVSGCVTALEIRREGGGSLLGEATSSANSSATKNMVVSFEVESGEEYYTAYAYNSSGASSSYTFKITGDTYESIEITDLEVEEDTVYDGDPINLTVYTTNSCEKLWVEDSRGERVSRTYTSPDDEDGSEYVWNVVFNSIEDNFKSSRSFTIIAQDEDKETAEKSVTIRFKKN